MRARDAARAVGAILRASLIAAFSYRAELVSGIFGTTLPLLILPVWLAVARGGPVGRFRSEQFVAYFLCSFAIRQLTSPRIAAQISEEILDGTMSVRLLRPIHPFISYGAETIATIPPRVVVAVPAAALAFLMVDTFSMTRDVWTWALWCLSLVGAWLITLFVHFLIGSLAFFVNSSSRFLELWATGFIAFGGYVVPLDLFPPSLRTVIGVLPFRFQLGFSVELMTGVHSRRSAAILLAIQSAWVFASWASAGLVWKRGIARYTASGG